MTTEALSWIEEIHHGTRCKVVSNLVLLLLPSFSPHLLSFLFPPLVNGWWLRVVPPIVWLSSKARRKSTVSPSMSKHSLKTLSLPFVRGTSIPLMIQKKLHLSSVVVDIKTKSRRKNRGRFFWKKGRTSEKGQRKKREGKGD
jgi:hypothetical protein